MALGVIELSISLISNQVSLDPIKWAAFLLFSFPTEITSFFPLFMENYFVPQDLFPRTKYLTH